MDPDTGGKVVATLISPDDDGVQHINVYSQGRTPLGRWLSNFTYAPFEHPIYGRFASMEAYWYWVATGMQHDHLRRFYDFSAKRQGVVLPRVPMETLDFYLLIVEGFLCKLLDAPDAAFIDLAKSDLPFVHYFVKDKRMADDNVKSMVIDLTGKHHWQMQAWTVIRYAARGNDNIPGFAHVSQNADWLAELWKVDPDSVLRNLFARVSIRGRALQFR